MKRDMDLVRKILLVCEEHAHGRAPLPLVVSGYSKEQIGYHVFLMGQAGFLKITDLTTGDLNSPYAIPVSVTWDGHEFLEASRNEENWSKAKAAATSAGGMALDVLKSILVELATSAARKAIGLP